MSKRLLQQLPSNFAQLLEISNKRPKIKMSAAAARRRKQLAAKQGKQDVVGTQLSKILESSSDMDEATAYEAMQLAQSQVRKKVQANEGAEGCELCYSTSLALLQKGRVSVASQLLTLLAEVLRETNTEETEEWITRLITLHEAHVKAMEATSAGMPSQEITRLQRLERDWLLRMLQWSADLGTVKFGNNRLQEVIGEHCWKLASIEAKDSDFDEEAVSELQCDAVQHMALAEKPLRIVEWLKDLPAPTDEETKAGHTCPPALRDGLLTRALLLLAAVENLRDANVLLRAFIDQVDSRDIKELAASYTNKEDGKAPSHPMFGCMLMRVLEKDVRTGPLFSWLMRSFKRELDLLYKPQALHGYCSKIGKIYFNIQPPPNMLSMVENMMGMMGGGGMGGPGGINPAMMQALAAQMKQGGM